MLALIGACAAVGMLAILSARTLRQRDTAGPSLRDAVGSPVFNRNPQDSTERVAVARDPATGGYTAVIVAQSADCDGNLGVFGVLDRQSIGVHVPHRLLLIQGAARDTIGLRFRLPRSLRNAHVALLSDQQRAEMLALGHRSTPTLLLYSRDRQLRYIGPSPPGPVERTVEVAVITQLVSNHPELTLP